MQRLWAELSLESCRASMQPHTFLSVLACVFWVVCLFVCFPQLTFVAAFGWSLNDWISEWVNLTDQRTWASTHTHSLWWAWPSTDPWEGCFRTKKKRSHQIELHSSTLIEGPGHMCYLGCRRQLGMWQDLCAWLITCPETILDCKQVYLQDDQRLLFSMCYSL